MCEKDDEKIVEATKKPIEGKIVGLNDPIETSWGSGGSVSDADPE